MSEYKQDPYGRSYRLWSAGVGLLSAMLVLPEFGVLVGEAGGPGWVAQVAPVAGMIVSSLLAAWSKLKDPRPRA